MAVGELTTLSGHSSISYGHAGFSQAACDYAAELHEIPAKYCSLSHNGWFTGFVLERDSDRSVHGITVTL